MLVGALIVFTGTAIAGEGTAELGLGTGAVMVLIGDLTYPIAIIGSLFGLVKGWKPVVRHELVIVSDGEGRPVTQRDLPELLTRSHRGPLRRRPRTRIATGAANVAET